MFTAFEDVAAEPVVRGFVHEPAEPNGDGVVLTHGAGGNCRAKLLVAVAESLAAVGFVVLRFDLPYRVERPFGPPRPGGAARDRAGIRRAAAMLRGGMIERTAEKTHPQKPRVGHPPPETGRVFLAGHSYGGRQASMLLAEDPDVAGGLLLQSYPLHPPGKPEQLRTQHFPRITKPVLFVHGVNDPFASSAELQSAAALIPGRHALLEVENAGHDLLVKKSFGELPERIAREFAKFVGTK